MEGGVEVSPDRYGTVAAVTRNVALLEHCVTSSSSWTIFLTRDTGNVSVNARFDRHGGFCCGCTHSEGRSGQLLHQRGQRLFEEASCISTGQVLIGLVGNGRVLLRGP